MWNILKPLTGPVIMFLIGLSINMTAFRSEWLSGFLMGFALFWGLMALLSNRALLDRFPRIVEWLPFLRMTAGPMMAAVPIADSYISGKHLRVADLAQGGTIRNRTLEDCHIYGPAVLSAARTTLVADCIFDVPAEAVFIVVSPEQKQIVGPITLIDCTIRRCHFHSIGIIGPPSQMAKLKGEATAISSTEKQPVEQAGEAKAPGG